MRQSIFILLFLVLIVSFSSCRKDFDTVASSGNLEFSKTKVYLDTVFSNIGSSTYSLKVYNRSNEDIKIPTIQLGKGLNSKYRIMVDGMSGNNKIFNNVELLAKDSLFVFIETTANIADATAVDFTYNDQILFDNGSNQQAVDLITLIQDCHFIKPNRSLDKKIYEKISVNGFDPDTNGHKLVAADFSATNPWHWTKEKPYVIYGNCVVPSGETLIIDAGAQIYFHKDATLIVDTNARIDIQGSLNTYDVDGKIINRNEVTFEGDRLEPEYENVPGQWGAVFLLSANVNKINYLTLKNAVVGLLMIPTSTFAPNLTITNSQIYDCSNYGILARNSTINGKNVVINSAGQACLACSELGPYNFTHCTFNNNWQNSKQVAVLINDYSTNASNVNVVTQVTADFKNCIIYGNNKIELYLDRLGNNFNTNFQNCLVRFDDETAVKALKDETKYDIIRNESTGNIKNKDPKFKNISRNQMNLLVGSSAIGKAIYLPSNPKDILEKDRTNPNDDIGAYKFIP